jgi:hypothetical protein
MNHLDDRLRTTLDELAGTVPPSPHARADLERRLARGGRRRPLLAVAAAAVVVAAVTVSVALNRQSSHVATGPGAGVTTTTVLPGGELTGPIELGRFTNDGIEKKAVLVVTAQNDGQHWCVDVQPGGPVFPLVGFCDIVRGWPDSAEEGSLMQTQSVLGSGPDNEGPLPNLLLFVTSPKIATLEVSAGDGRPVTVDRLAMTPEAGFYLADFGGTSAGFGYTAKDAAGNVLVTAIT